MKKVTVAIVVVCVLLWAGCGGSKSSSTSTTITVSLSPTSASLNQGQTVQFTATVTGSSNTNVTWKVNGTEGGSTSTGTISTSGLYTAPATISSAVFVTITAVSQADTTISGVATVQLNPPPAPYTPGLVINPTAVTLPGGAQQGFTATANGAPVTATWSVTCNSTTPADCGTIDANTGSYIAPYTPPSGGGITVTASATGTNPGSAAVTVQYANQSLTGQYAFVFSGRNPAGTYGAMAGSVIFDGLGNVTGGELDATGSVHGAISGGTYHVDNSGRGSISIVSSAGNSTFQFSLQNHSHANAVVVPGTGAFAAATMAGSLDLQDPAQLTALPSQGNFAFLVTGASSGHAAASLHRAGVLSVDGSGAISGGVMDQNDAGTATSGTAVTGTYAAPVANGRGTLTINGSITMAYYAIDANRWDLLDPTSTASGVATRQAAGPFAASNINAVYVFTMAGASGTGPSSTGGLFTATATANTTGTLAATSTFDVNDNGNVVVPSQSFAAGATFTVADAATGRTTMTWTETTGPKNVVAYPAASGTLYLLSLDGFSESGTAYVQQPVNSASALAGTFVTRAFGVQFNPAGPLAFAGLTIPGGGTAFSGTLDINNNSVASLSTALNGQFTIANGIASVAVNPSSLALPNTTFKWYAAGRTRVLLMENDSSRVLTGVMEKQ